VEDCEQRLLVTQTSSCRRRNIVVARLGLNGHPVSAISPRKGENNPKDTCTAALDTLG